MGHRRHEEAPLWKEAYQFTLRIYRLTRIFPALERQQLARQLRNAAGAILMNIAEALDRTSEVDKDQFVSMAYASASESEYLLSLVQQMGYAKTLRLRAMAESLCSQLANAGRELRLERR
ncbi:MAG: four helix bundle protein [Bryobacterales bacterium]|nr:four helix bundle protein [Bryobacterales bacterium]